MDAESSLAAIAVAMSGRRAGGPTVVLTAALQFVRHYLLKQGFRNGFPGLAWSFMKAVGSAMTYLKARELVTGSVRVRDGVARAGGGGGVRITSSPR